MLYIINTTKTIPATPFIYITITSIPAIASIPAVSAITSISAITPQPHNRTTYTLKKF